jgi:hypothetical protein
LKPLREGVSHTYLDYRRRCGRSVLKVTGMTDQPSQHPAFPQPDDLTTPLWRYMELWKFEWLTSASRLYMPRADIVATACDLFEGTTPEGEHAWWQQLADNAETAEQRATIEHNRSLLSRFAAVFVTRHYLSCWYLSAYENAAMWERYGRTAEAVAIQTTYSMLRASLPSHVELGLVRYIDYSTARLPSLNLFECIMHKRIEYIDEREVRAVATDLLPDAMGGAAFREHHFEQEASPHARVYAPPVDLQSLIHSVVLPPNASSEVAARVAGICEAANLPRPSTSSMTRRPRF